jgi:hypothetical protein
MVDATVRQNKKYTVPLALLVTATYKRFTRRFWGVNLLITGGELPVTFPVVLLEKSIPPSIGGRSSISPSIR